MPEYKAPLRDMRFLIDEVFDFHGRYQALGASDATPDMVAAILDEGSKFCEQVLAPLNRSGDEEGCHFDNGVVTTPKGFKEAYAQYVEGGWNGVASDPAYGGQGLPHSLGLLLSEMIGASNVSWGMYPGLTRGAMSAIHAHGSQAQKDLYLARMTAGTWTGTMCLTEPHPKAPDKPADPIIVHPDVRRMLLTMKAFNEGNRALAYFTAQLLDTEHLSQDAAERERAADLLAFLTPICKAFMTETGQEVTNLGMQVYGGHGYIREWGMEQLVRDCRIAQIYEGTNGIQALDLLGRKVLGSQGKLLRGFTKLVHQLCQAQAEHPQLKGQVAQLAALNAQWGELTQQVGLAAMKNADEVGAASVDYLMFSGYVTLAYFWLRIALVAREKLDAGSGEAAFYEAKLATADFYFSRLLPRTAAHAAAIQAGAAGLMSLSAEQFSL